MSGLSPQQERFVAEYLVDLNGTKAAIRAGYAEGSASVQASRLLANDKIIAKTKEGVAKLITKIEVNAESVKRELAKCGFSNMQDYMTVGPDGDPTLDWSKLTREQAAALGEVTVDRYTEGKGDEARDVKRVKFKLVDKLSALEKLGKHLGMFKDGTNVAVQVNIDSDLVQALGGLAGKKADV